MVLWRQEKLTNFYNWVHERIKSETASSVTALCIKDKFARDVSYRPPFLASNTVRPMTICCFLQAFSISPHCDILQIIKHQTGCGQPNYNHANRKIKNISQSLTVSCVLSNKTSNIPCSRTETHLQWCLNTSERKNNCFSEEKKNGIN